MRAFILFFMLVAVTSFGQSIRPVTQWNDINKLDENYYQSKITWFVGDSLQMDVYARNGRDAIAFDGAAFPVLYIAARTNPSQVYTVATGIVVNATAGHVRVSSYSSSLPVSPGIDYSLWMAVLRPASGTVEVNTVAYSAVNVLTSPPGATYTNLPPGTAPFQFTLGSVAIPDSYSNAVEQRIVLAQRAGSNLLAVVAANNLATSNELNRVSTNAVRRSGDTMTGGLTVPSLNGVEAISGTPNLGISGLNTLSDVNDDPVYDGTLRKLIGPLSVDGHLPVTGIVSAAEFQVGTVRITPTTIYIGANPILDLDAGQFDGSAAQLNNQSPSYYLDARNHTDIPASWTAQPSLLTLSGAVAAASASAAGAAAAATNFGLAIGAGATNFSLAIGRGATQLVADASAQGTNFALLIGRGATQLVAGASAQGTNFALQIGAGTTALVAQAAAQGTNFALAIGAGSTSLVAASSAQGTNFALAIGRGATQLVAGASGAASNLSFAIGAGATQLVASAAAAGTNFALSIGRGATQLVAVATANMATGGQWNAAIATATQNMATNDQWATDVASAVSGLATTNSLAILSLKHDVATNKLETVFGWGNHATNGYAVNGQNITGRWFAVGNTNTGAGGFSFLGGGAGNKLQGTVAVIVGGQNNYIDATGLGGFIGGGRENSIYGQYTVIGGGEGNTASFTGQRSFIGGGYYNSSVGFYGSIGGGKNNNITGDYGTIPGGYNNEASSNSFAVGVGARATNAGSFVVSLPGDTNATFSSRGDNTFNVRSVGGTYFLSPDFWIQGTNGSTIARFSATGTVVRGPFQIGMNSIHYDELGNMLATDVWIRIASATNALEPVRFDQLQAWQASNAPLSSIAASTAALASAQASISALTVSVGSLILTDASFQTNLVAVNSNRTNDLANRIGADASLSGSVASVQAQHVATSNNLALSIAGVSTALQTATGTLTDAISAEISDRESADTSITNLLSQLDAAVASATAVMSNLNYAVSNTVNAARLGGSLPAAYFLLTDFQSEMTNRIRMVQGITSVTSAGGFGWMQFVPSGTGTNELWVYNDHALGTNAPGWSIFKSR